MKKVTLACLLLINFIAFMGELRAQEPLGIKIERMLELMGSKEQFDMVITQMIDLQKEAYSGILSNEFFDEFEKRAKEEGFTEIAKQLTPVYLKHFTEEEIDGLIKFYGSDIGQSLIKKTPLIMQESMAIGGEWGRKIGQEIAETIALESQNVEDERKFNTVLEDDLSKFKNGKFFYFTEDSSRVEIIRTDDQQIEIIDGVQSKMEIQWISNNRYLFSNMKKRDENLPSDILTVNIYEATENSYKFVAKMEGVDYYLVQELFREE